MELFQFSAWRLRWMELCGWHLPPRDAVFYSIRQYSKWRKNSTFRIYTLVKENKKATFFYGIVSVLGVAPTVDGTLWLTFATSWRQVRISKYENSKSKSIKSKHTTSVFTSKLNLRPPNTQIPFDFSSNYFSNWMKTKTTLKKHSGRQRVFKLKTRRDIPYLQANIYYFVYYIDILIVMFFKISRRFPKILQKLFEGHMNVTGHFPKISWHYRRFHKIL